MRHGHAPRMATFTEHDMARTGKANTKRMSAETFEAVRRLVPNLSGLRIDVARAVLVDGSTYQAAADQFGGTRQNAHKATTTVWDAYERFQRVALDVSPEVLELLRSTNTSPDTVEVSSGDTGPGENRKDEPESRKKTRPAKGEPG